MSQFITVANEIRSGRQRHKFNNEKKSSFASFVRSFFLFYVLQPLLSNPQGGTTSGRRRHFFLLVSKPFMPGQSAHISLDKRLTII